MSSRGCTVLLLIVTSLGCGPSPESTIPDASPGPDAAADAATDAAPSGPSTISIAVDGSATVGTRTEWYLSFTVDTEKFSEREVSPVHWDSPKLRRMVQELAPAVMRIGGTVADKLYYDLSDDPVDTPPAPYTRVMTKAQFDAACDFATAVGLEIAFTLDAGDGPRDVDGRWTPDAARALVEHAVSIGCPVTVWELGNEVSSYMFEGIGEVSPEQYSQDFVTARAMLDEVDPGALLGGPASAYMPTMGEATLNAGGFLPLFVTSTGPALDVVTWHYYPTQSDSDRCDLIRVVPADWDRMLDPEQLDDVIGWAGDVEQARDVGSPEAEVWLGETGHAMCGGQEGVSDRFVAGLWWLDELGVLARTDQQVVARQSLTGGKYHLIENDTLVPYPDYFNSILFRRLMGSRVLAAPEATVTEGHADASLLRLYAHCTPDRPGAVTVLAINLSQDEATKLEITGAGDARELYLLTSDDPTSEHVQLDGLELAVADDGSPPAMDPVVTGDLVLPPISYAFVVLPDAAAAACP